MDRRSLTAWAWAGRGLAFALPLFSWVRELSAHPAAFHPGSEAQASGWQTLGEYLGLGFSHILPDGLDHVLFVLGLYLCQSEPRALLLQLSAFTVAHSLTLALSTLGVVEAPASVVEPLIALSIAFVALENALFGSVVAQPGPGLGAHRVWVVLAFGLLHGLGFAGALRESGIPEGHFLLALVSFNLGVELGQLAVVMAAALAVGWWARMPWYERALSRPASALIAFVGLYWLIERLA